MSPLDRLLAVLRPGGPAVATGAFDAELATLGVELTDAAAESEILRCLAAAGPMLRDVLRATLERTPKSPIQPHLERLVARGYVVVSGKSYDLAPAWRGRFGEFARLNESPLQPPVVDWPGALTALTKGSRCEPAKVAEVLCGALGWPLAGAEFECVRAAVTRCDGETRALLAWLAPRAGHPTLRLLVDYGISRVEAGAQAALGESPGRVQALEASLFVCLSDFADVLTPVVLDAPGERREELLRRWCWFLGVPVPQETPGRTVIRLASLDYRRVLASLEAAEIEAESQAVQAKLFDEERARRKAAAESYSSGRRE